jgi:H+/Cl- antiporter ClcA
MQSVSPHSWTDFFVGLNPEQRWLLLVIALGCSIGLILGLVGIVSSTLRSMQHHRAELALKREMLDRGMSADEIAKVIEATASSRQQEATNHAT